MSALTRPEQMVSRAIPRGRWACSYTRVTATCLCNVQLMYPKSASSLSNEYVRNGYEASFGSYTVDERTHTLTHHVLGSVTGDALVGKDLPRIYTLTGDGRLVIRPANPEEHRSVTWQHNRTHSAFERLASAVRKSKAKGVKQCRNANWERAI